MQSLSRSLPAEPAPSRGAFRFQNLLTAQLRQHKFRLGKIVEPEAQMLETVKYQLVRIGLPKGRRTCASMKKEGVQSAQ